MTPNEDGGIGSEKESTIQQNKHSKQVVQRHYNPDDDGELTTDIIFAIAEAKDVEPEEVKSPLLYEVVDVPSIEEAFFGFENESGNRQSSGTVMFHYTNYVVNINTDGWIKVYQTAEQE